jgi:hypothetical protein
MKGVIDLSCQGNLRRRVKLTWVVDGIGEVCGEMLSDIDLKAKLKAIHKVLVLLTNLVFQVQGAF